MLLTVLAAAEVVVLGCNTNMTVVESNKPAAIGTVRPSKYRFRFTVESDNAEVFDDFESSSGPRRHVGQLVVTPGLVTITWEAGMTSQFEIDRKSLALSGTASLPRFGIKFSYRGTCRVEESTDVPNKF